jgi:hypothetical protein
MSLQMDASRDATQPAASRAPQVNRAETARDLQATLEARRELGPGYDEHFLDALVERLTQAVATQKQQRAPASPPSHEYRLGLAITSMALLIPLVAIVLGMGMGFAGLVVVCLTILAINLGFRYL